VGVELTDLLLKPRQMLFDFCTLSLERVDDLLNARHDPLLADAGPANLLEKVPLTSREHLLSVALSPQLARLLAGLFVALRDLLAKVVEGDGRGRPTRARFLVLLRHQSELLIAPLGTLPTGRMRERDTQAVDPAP
jgi:hypothetical protein